MTEKTAHARYVDSIIEAQEMRADIRKAADEGNFEEVERLVHRIHDLELLRFAWEYTECRYQRKQRRELGGYNPTLERLEHQLNGMLSKIGVSIPRDMWSHRG